MDVKINYLNKNEDDTESLIDDFLGSINEVDLEKSNKTDGVSDLFRNGSIIYLNSTEVSPLYDLIIPKDEVLTVLGSGDFLLDAIFHGASKIVTFDVNKKQIYPASLKVKGLQYLDYEDYYDFFSDAYSKRYLTQNLYNYIKKISEKDEDLYLFWDKLIKQINKDRKVINSELKKLNLPTKKNELIKALSNYGYFYNNGLSERTLNYILYRIDPDYNYETIFSNIMGLQGDKNRDFYLGSKKNFDKTKKKIKSSEIDFIRCDIKSIKNELDRISYLNSSDYDRFQTIYLSNIPEYLDSTDFLRCVENELIPILKTDGVIAYCCQGISYFTLTMSDEVLNKIKNLLNNNNTNFEDALKLQKIVNSVEIFRELRKKYKIEIYYNGSLDMGNGFDNYDSYVYVKKK